MQEPLRKRPATEARADAGRRPTACVERAIRTRTRKSWGIVGSNADDPREMLFKRQRWW